jgi:hypothetical protein
VGANLADQALRFNGPLEGRSMSSPPSRWDLAVLAAKGSACRVGFAFSPQTVLLNVRLVAGPQLPAVEGQGVIQICPGCPGWEFM